LFVGKSKGKFLEKKINFFFFSKKGRSRPHTPPRFRRGRCHPVRKKKKKKKKNFPARSLEIIVQFCKVHNLHYAMEEKDEGGFTPLLMAVWMNQCAIVKLLLTEGAAKNVFDKTKRSLAHLATLK
jgi:hypothetical protein